MKIVRVFPSAVHFVYITPFAVCMQHASFVTTMIISYHVVIMILLSPKTWQHLVINDLTIYCVTFLKLMTSIQQLKSSINVNGLINARWIEWYFKVQNCIHLLNFFGHSIET